MSSACGLSSPSTVFLRSSGNAPSNHSLFPLPPGTHLSTHPSSLTQHGDHGGFPLKLKGKHNRTEDRKAGTKRPEEEDQRLIDLG